MHIKGYIVCIGLLLNVLVSAQTMVYLEHSQILAFDEARLPDAQILRGEVRFRHEDVLMYCDSAYFYEKSNSIDAFGHVRFVQGDTLFGYGDKLYYDGNTRLARLRKHVKLVHKTTILTTDSLNYDRNTDVAYYFTGGVIQDSIDTLSSVWGQYKPSTYQACFRHNVHLQNDRFTLQSDTLLYNTNTYIADIQGPTEILYEKETTIHSTKGWYNTSTEHSMLLNRSTIIHDDGTSMIGDTIYYDKKTGFGKVLQQIEITDSVQQLTLYGNYGEMYEEGNRGMVTDSALMVDWSNAEDWTYLHGDTLFTQDVTYDTIHPDSTYMQVKAYYGVRMYNTDFQAVCDSLVYTESDSTIRMYTNPVCWNDNNQISADQIDIHLKDSTIDTINGTGNALIIQQETDSLYNQMGGKETKAFVRDGKLSQVDVKGNAETIYYPLDKGKYIGMNVTQSSTVSVFIEDEKIHHVLFLSEPRGTIYPMDQIPSGKDKLSTFFWAADERPLVPGDVFKHPARTARTAAVAVSAVVQPTTEKTTNELKQNSKNKNKEQTNTLQNTL